MRKRRLLGILAVVVIAGCGSGISIRQDYDRTVDFRRFRRYSWVEPAASTDPAQRVNTIVDRRIKQAVNVNLLSRGMQLVEEAPDILVAYHTGTQDRIDVSGAGYTYGSYWGGAGVNTYHYQQGTLILDIIDARTKELVWRGSASKTLDDNPTPEKIDKTINEAVTKLLKDYPPKLD